MPYIDESNRKTLLMYPLGNCPIMSDDELSFAILVLLNNYNKRFKDVQLGSLGAIENAKAEFQRTVVEPANRQAEYENGEVK